MKDSIIGRDWDYLIILDACRYDYFKKVYRNFFDGGKLKRKTSDGTNTVNWFSNTFDGIKFSETIYVSTNPHIRSLEVSSPKKFFKIIDAWKSEWNEKLKTVHPKDLNKKVLETIKKYPKKRFIIHYMQPHQPYIGKKYRKYIKKVENKKEESKKIKSLLGKNIWYFIKKLDAKIYWKLAKLLNVPTTHACKIGMEKGMRGVKKAYKRNLEIVLEYVSKLTKKLDGKIIITSDHGECLGENGKFGHSESVSNLKILREVPWFEINNN